MEWNEERITALKSMWLNGLSASEVARQLGGVSRSAVIGKVHRLGISWRDTPERKRNVGGRPSNRLRARSEEATAPRREAPPAPRKAPVSRTPFETTAGATILTLRDNSCRWPIGDPGEADFGFCGRERFGHGPYCAGHAPIAFRGARKAMPIAPATLAAWEGRL